MSTEIKKKSPNLDLRGKEGNYVVGEFKGRFESKQFPGKFSSLIKVEELEGSTTLYDKDLKKNVEVDIEAGDSVFLAESTWLARFMSERKVGDRIRIEYTGKGTAKRGQKAPYIYKTEVL